MIIPSEKKRQKNDKKIEKLDKEFQSWVKRGWLYVDGIGEDGRNIYKFTTLGLAVARRKMKGFNANSSFKF